MNETQEMLQTMITQQQQQIDISMLLLKNNNMADADFLDYVHNERHLFLSELNQDQFTLLMSDFERDVQHRQAGLNVTDD